MGGAGTGRALERAMQVAFRLRTRPARARPLAHHALRLTQAGLSLKQIGYELGVSGATAFRLREHALAELGYASIFEFLRATTPRQAACELPLTGSERDIARSVASGCSNREIARARGTSVRTVANQINGIFRKLRVQSRVELTLLQLAAE
jgi:DNA-binding CsgD family transcriptional regulator